MPSRHFSICLMPTLDSTTYIQSVLSRLPSSQLHLGSDIKSIERRDGRVTVKMANGTSEVFDHVIMACHSDTALQLLENPTEQEKQLLGCFKWNRNEVVVHSDVNVSAPFKHFCSC